ncbi:MAG: hypothetical protein O2867_06470 [Bacteroidetes bacterium]|nr:hypothetical protein [Bacteroidota bacterium]
MKSFFSIAFVVMLLFQSLGLTFGTHYCGGKAVSHTLMVAKLTDMSCGKTSESSSCDKHEGREGIHKKKCCQNEFVALHTDDEFSGSGATLTPKDVLLFTAATQQFLDYITSTPYSADYSKYDPPLISSDLQALLQVFRI